MNTITIPALSDYHVHGRQGTMMTKVLPHTGRVCGRCMLMPNTIPPITSEGWAKNYLQDAKQLMSETDVLLAFKLTPQTKPEDVTKLKAAGCIAGKLYPEGVTTHSGDGITREMLMEPKSYPQYCEVLTAMEQENVILSIHPELPGGFVLDREEQFLECAETLGSMFRRLRIVMEHVTTASAVWFVQSRAPQFAATITADHLLLTLDDVLTPKLQPHNFRMPIPKRSKDRKQLRRAVLAGFPNFFLGSDSAPHARADKECAHGCAGTYTAPILAELLADFFDEHDAMGRITDFTSTFGDQFYGKEPTQRKLTLVKDPWTIPPEYDGVVPFMAGKQLNWKVVS